jgi:hypothetical protein
VESKDLGIGKVLLADLPGGDRALTVDLETKSNFEATSSESTPDSALSEEAITEQVDSLRNNYEMMKGMMGMVLSNLRLNMEIDLPGTPKEVTGFSRTSDGGLRFGVEGKRIIEAMDSVMSDSLLLRQQLRTQGTGADPMKGMFFPKGELRAVIPAGTPARFDYGREVAAAKQEYIKLMKDLNRKKPSKKKSGRGTPQLKS